MRNKAETTLIEDGGKWGEPAITMEIDEVIKKMEEGNRTTKYARNEVGEQVLLRVFFFLEKSQGEHWNGGKIKVKETRCGNIYMEEGKGNKEEEKRVAEFWREMERRLTERTIVATLFLLSVYSTMSILS